MNVRTLREHLNEFRARSLLSSLAALALALTSYGAASYGALALSSTPVRLALGLVAGVASGSLFMMGHDACHGSFARRASLNGVLGRIAFLPTYHTYSLWDLSHNRIHHAHTNLKGRDFVWTPLSRAEFDALPRWRRALYRIYRTPLGLSLYYPIEIWRVWLFFPRRERLDRARRSYTLDSLLVLGFLSLQIAGTLALRREGLLDWVVGAVFSLVVPWMVFNWLIGFVIFFNHTHPAVPWFDKPEEWSWFTGMVRGAVRLRLPRWSLPLAPNIMNHVAHHVDPRIPLVHLDRASDRLEELLVDQIVVQAWSVADLLDILRRCKLYDYDAHRWLDYHGNPTTEPSFPFPRPVGLTTR
jgi:omega-6 fatty acid desaturase (delta-12 desaturase)